MDGQTEFAKALTNSLKAAVTTKPPVKGVARKGKRKGRKEVFDAEAANAEREATVSIDQQTSTWGVLEPVHGMMKAFISLLGPFMTSQVVIAVLTVLLLYTWISPPARSSAVGASYPGYSSPQRLAAYQELWRREESSLWNWLEDRAGLENIYLPSGDASQKDRLKAGAASKLGKKLDDERMSERQMDDAIRVTEERLAALKIAVGRRKAGKRDGRT